MVAALGWSCGGEEGRDQDFIGHSSSLKWGLCKWRDREEGEETGLALDTKLIP